MSMAEVLGKGSGKLLHGLFEDDERTDASLVSILGLQTNIVSF